MKRLFQITPARLRALEKTWRSTINRFRGPVPAALGIAHMVAESNGDEDPTIRDATIRPIGLMQIPYREGRRRGYTETTLLNTTNNIYVWALKSNTDAAFLHNTYPSAWTEPNYDFWLAVRLVFIVGQNIFSDLYTAAAAGTSPGAIVTAIQSWITNTMTSTQRFGTFRASDLLRISDHLDKVRSALNSLDGPNKVSRAFTEAPTISPGNEIDVLYTTVAM